MLRAFLLLYGLLYATAVHTADVVVTLCRERTTHHAQLYQKVLESSGKVTATLFAYCKCGSRMHACIELPNVGREAHTFLHHILKNYDTLADVTFFVNGGTGPDGERARVASQLAATVSLHAASLHFVDSGITLHAPLRVVSNETSENILRRAAVFDCPTNSQGVRCCSACHANCCHLFVPSMCAGVSYMVFHNQTECYWKGNTLENYEGVEYNPKMQPASPANFPKSKRSLRKEGLGSHLTPSTKEVPETEKRVVKPQTFFEAKPSKQVGPPKKAVVQKRVTSP